MALLWSAREDVPALLPLACAPLAAARVPGEMVPLAGRPVVCEVFHTGVKPLIRVSRHTALHLCGWLCSKIVSRRAVRVGPTDILRQERKCRKVRRRRSKSRRMSAPAQSSGCAESESRPRRSGAQGVGDGQHRQQNGQQRAHEHGGGRRGSRRGRQRLCLGGSGRTARRLQTRGEEGGEGREHAACCNACLRCPAQGTRIRSRRDMQATLFSYPLAAGTHRHFADQVLLQHVHGRVAVANLVKVFRCIAAWNEEPWHGWRGEKNHVPGSLVGGDDAFRTRGHGPGEPRSEFKHATKSAMRAMHSPPNK